MGNDIKANHYPLKSLFLIVSLNEMLHVQQSKQIYSIGAAQ